MVRSCSDCASSGKVSEHCRGTTTFYCTLWGRVVRGDDACKFYCRRGTSTGRRFEDFDLAVAFGQFEKVQLGKLPRPGDAGGPGIVPTNLLQKRSAKKEGRA